MPAKSASKSKSAPAKKALAAKPTAKVAKMSAKSAAKPAAKAAKGAIGTIKKMLGLKGAKPAGKAAKEAPKGKKPEVKIEPKLAAKGAKATPGKPVSTKPLTKQEQAKLAAEEKAAAKAAGKAAAKQKGGASGRESLTTLSKSAAPVEHREVIAGPPVCREVACELIATTGGYCRMHYIKNWKKIKRKEIILRERKLNHYIEELVSKYPDKYIEAIRQDLASEKDFAKVIADLEIEEGLDDFESVETENAEGIIDNIKRDFEDEGDVF